MSTLHRNTPPPVQPEPSLELLLPGEQPNVELAPPADLLEPYVSAQSLTGHDALEDVAPFSGVYNVDGLLFIELDGRTYEVEFDTDNFRFNLVAPRAPDHGMDESAAAPANREQVLRGWHPTYLAGSQRWLLLPATSRVSSTVEPARLMTLPHQVDALLTTGDLVRINDTVGRFLLQNTPQPNDTQGTQTLLSLLAAPHLAVLKPGANAARPTQKSLSIVLDSMLSSAPAETLAGQLLKALEWYGGEDGEVTAPVIRQQLVWAALMLELNPPEYQRPGHVAGCDLEGPQNWGLTYRQRQTRLLNALAAKTATPELALYILSPAIPDFVVEGIDEDLRYGTAAWVNFVHGVSLGNTLAPALASTLTFEEVIQLPMNLSKEASYEELTLIATTRALPSLTWATANGLSRSEGTNDFSLSEMDAAAAALDGYIANALEAAEGMTREVPDRVRLAMGKLRDIFGAEADDIKKMLMYPAAFSRRLEHLLRSDPSSDASHFYLLDVFSAGEMVNGTDTFKPVTPRAPVRGGFDRISTPLIGIDIPRMFEAQYRFYEARAKAAYAFIIEELLTQLPAEDRRALHCGRVKIHTVRTSTGKLAGFEVPEDRERKRGRYGFILECADRENTFYYELFPLVGVAVRHTRLAIPTRRAHPFPSALPSALEIVSGNAVGIDWDAYANLTKPQPGKTSVVISEMVAELAPLASLPDDAGTALTSARLKDISFEVATTHLFFYSHDAYLHHRHQTASEEVASNYPPLLRSLELFVPGLACTNAIATDESPAVACTLDALTFGIPALRLLRGAIRLAFNAGKLSVMRALPTFAQLMPAVFLSSAHVYRATRASSTFMPGAIGKLLASKAFNMNAFHALARRMHGIARSTAGISQGLRHVSGIPTITTPTQWHGTSTMDVLAKVGDIENVPVRRISNAVSRTQGAYYLITSGCAYGPRLIARRAMGNSLQRINGRPGYPLSGRGAMKNPIAGPDSGTLGPAIDATTDLADVMKVNGISATPEQLTAIREAVEDGTPLFIYETANGSKSIALHDVYDGIYLDALTNLRVSVFRFYNHATLKTWRVDPALQANVMQVAPQRLNPGRGELIQKRLDDIKSGITEGQYLPPIHVRELENGAYPVVNGNHRLAAALDMQLETVPVLIV